MVNVPPGIRTWPRVLRAPAGTSGSGAAGPVPPIATSTGIEAAGAQQDGVGPEGAWSGVCMVHQSGSPAGDGAVPAGDVVALAGVAAEPVELDPAAVVAH